MAKKKAKKETIKQRVSKVDERFVALAKRYPLVFAAVFMLGVASGASLMGILL
jgi:hypothetical protein